MNKEEINKLQEVINDQLDLIEMNVARINNKDYFGLDFELLKYIRNLENQLDIANKKLEEIKEYCNEKLKWNRDDGNDYWAGKNNAQQQVSEDILSIIGGNDE